MKYENIGTLDISLLSEFKAYAKITTTDEDALITDMLTEALLLLAENTDRAMMPCTLFVDSVSDVSSLRLYQLPISQIVSVKDAAGNNVTDYALRGNEVQFRQSGRYTVSYMVVPDAAEVRRYKYFAFQLASAMHDGNDEEQTKILRQIPASFI